MLAHSIKEPNRTLQELSVINQALDQAAAFVILDSTGTIQFANQAFYRLSDYGPEVTGQSFEQIFSDAQNPTFREVWAAVAQETVWRSETCHKTKTGTQYWCDTIIVSFAPSEGPPQHVCIQRDITDFKSQQKNVGESDNYTQAGQLMPQISHDLKNALTALQVGLDQMKGKIPQFARLLELMTLQVDHMNQLLKSMLTLSRTGIEPGIKRLWPLEELIEPPVHLLSLLAARNNIEIVTHLQRSSLTIPGNILQIHEVFLNILKNAVESMASSGEIHISVIPRATEVAFRITDQGRGMSQELLARLNTEPLTTKKQGHGLGLPISRRIINEHQGKLTISSMEGHGTIVEVYCLRP